jgi:hypothetical protein
MNKDAFLMYFPPYNILDLQSSNSVLVWVNK